MRQLKVGVARPEDTEEIGKWLEETPGNLLDPEVMTYPTLRVISSYDGETNVAHLPSQQVVALMLESLAVNPAAPHTATAQAFRDLVKAMQVLASSFGIRELYFMCKDEAVLKLAEGHGFERIELPVVRMKLR